MSSMEIYAVNQEGDIHLYGQARNSWRGAMRIWKELGDRYAGGFNLLMDTSPESPFWRSVDRMHPLDQWVFCHTFDGAICPRESLPRLIEALEHFVQRYPTGEEPEDTGLTAELVILRRALADENVRAVCWNATTVNSNPWWRYATDDDEDEGVSVNIDRDQTDANGSQLWLLTKESVESVGATP